MSQVLRPPRITYYSAVIIFTITRLAKKNFKTNQEQQEQIDSYIRFFVWFQFLFKF